MQIRISKNFLKRIEKGDTPYPVYVIKPPDNVSILTGYVLKILMEDISATETSLLINRGNGWDKKTRQDVFIFEKEVKNPEHRSKRYKYTEKDLEKLYSNSMQMSFKDWLSMKRTQVLEAGPGRLVKASCMDVSKRAGKVIREGWFVLPDADARWAYPIRDDPVLDKGKIWAGAKGFTIQKEYLLQDISVLREHKEQIAGLLSELDRIRYLKLNPQYNLQRLYVDQDGMYCIARSTGEALAITCYSAIPDDVTHSKKEGSYFKLETPEGEELRMELTGLGMEMERKCREILAHYQNDQIERITRKIKNLIDIEVSEG